MRKARSLTIIPLLWFCLLPCLALSQIQEKDKFTIRITRIERVQDGCIVQAVTDKVRYKLSSDISGPCSMLKAGQDYKAARGSVGDPVSPEDGTKDTPVLIIFNNVQDRRWPSAAFDIVLEEAR